MSFPRPAKSILPTGPTQPTFNHILFHLEPHLCDSDHRSMKSTSRLKLFATLAVRWAVRYIYIGDLVLLVYGGVQMHAREVRSGLNKSVDFAVDSETNERPFPWYSTISWASRLVREDIRGLP